MIMNNHKKRMEQVKRRKCNSSANSAIAFNNVHYENPKKNYMLETKYTEIERENRMLFEKIAGINKKKKKHTSFSINHISSLNSTIRKQQV